MGQYSLKINGQQLTGSPGQTILDIARENRIFIPSLCHDDRVKMYGSCGLCVVEAAGNPRLLRACSTLAAEGMDIQTESEKLSASRKTALELLLSDHRGDCRAPCMLACPAGTDCQGYVGLIANGKLEEANNLIKDKIPLPASIGRVCPHPCEDACRRRFVEEPISIAALKAYAADKTMDDAPAAVPGADSGKKVVVVGGGPGGLSAAYYLRQSGHAVTLLEAMPLMGGMLRYGIPEYRLPKKILQKEIEKIQAMGVNFQNNVRLGVDITLDELRESYDAVVLALGAWSSMALGCPGEELQGVFGGIDFLRAAAENPALSIGKRVAVVGGGNTAMDACRTLLRLDAAEVYNIYRRTIEEMPAEEEEIREALDEGVVFKNLRNPIEISGDGGKLSAIRLQVMELGEPDASGRRAPVAVPGEEESIALDAVVIAIGQRLNPAGLDGLELTKRKTVAADFAYRTNIEGVFAIGDAVNKGADIAIAAIAGAKKAAAAIDRYLSGEEPIHTEPFLSKTEPETEDFTDRPKKAREHPSCRSAETRKGDFLPIHTGLTDEQAHREAARCLECGCQDFYECKLLDLSNRYQVNPQKYQGDSHNREFPDKHPFLHRNPDKCILCGLCARACEEVIGQTVYGLVGRGFDTVVRPAGEGLCDSGCVSCGLCADVCPTGAICESPLLSKPVPLAESSVETTCSFCGVGCHQILTYNGGTLLRVMPSAKKQKDALLCAMGRFGLNAVQKAERITRPLMRINGNLTPVSYEQAISFTTEKLLRIRSDYGENSIAVTISGRYTNEEALMICEYANNALGIKNVFSFSKLGGGLGRVFGRDVSTVGLEELANADLILVVESDIQATHMVAGLHVKRAADQGAKIIALNSFDSFVDEFAYLRITPENDLSLLRQMLAYALRNADIGKIKGVEHLVKSLEGVTAGEEAKAIMDLYLAADRAVIYFDQARISLEAAELLGALSVVSGHNRKESSGIVQLKRGANAQGLSDLGISGRDKLLPFLESERPKALMIFGEDIGDITFPTEFLVVQELYLTETAQKADVVFPAQSHAETNGTFTNSFGERRKLRAAVPVLPEQDTFMLLQNLFAKAGYASPYRTIADAGDAYLKATQSVVLNNDNPSLASISQRGILKSDKQKNTNALIALFEDFMDKHS